MRGTVRKVSTVNGFVAIETVRGEFTIAEPLGGEVEPGDQLDGDLESLGGQTLLKVPTAERLSVFIQDCHADAARAGAMLSAP